MKILILCTGNSCRSQMAHGLLQSLDENLEVRSAGTHPANAVHPLAIQVMKDVGIDINGHKPTNVAEYTGESWDYVITVCDDANESCPVFISNVKHRLHIGFEDPSKAEGNSEFIMSEFIRIRDEIKKKFSEFYVTEILKRELPKCSCGGNC